MSVLTEINETLQKGRSKVVCELVQNALDEKYAPSDILQSLIDGMDIIGTKFKNNEVFVPEVLVSARAMNKSIAILKPYLQAEGATSQGKVVLGTVKGDLHDIGKNLVRIMMESKGLEVIDLGVDVEPERFIQTAIDENCKVIACSALLSTTMEVMGDVVAKAVEAGIRDKVKIIVGGAPVTQRFCESIGADVYTPDAASAADAALQLVKS